MSDISKPISTPNRCPFCGNDLVKQEKENGWGDEDGHRTLTKHTCEHGHRFYVE